MAQNVTIAGRTYSDVPAIDVPKQGGGLATFTDVTGTTAIAEDVRQGKYFFTASGVLTLGTSTGGGSGSITQDEDGYLVLDDQGGGGGGGGASNIVEGTFTANNSQGVQTVSIPYSGNGFPISVSVFSPSVMSNVQGMANGIFAWVTVLKLSMTDPPTFNGNLWNNRYIAYCDYINSGTYSASSNPTGTWTAAGADATETANLGMRLVSNTQMSIYVAGSSYGFLPGGEYRYIVVYSS